MRLSPDSQYELHRKSAEEVSREEYRYDPDMRRYVRRYDQRRFSVQTFVSEVQVHIQPLSVSATLNGEPIDVVIGEGHEDCGRQWQYRTTLADESVTALE